MGSHLLMAALVGIVSAGSACRGNAVEEAKEETGAALYSTRAGADKAFEATKKAREETADVVLEAVPAPGNAADDSWITTKLKAKFADETALRGSGIYVDTDRRVVTLTGTVLSAMAKARVDAIARGTEGVARVVDNLVVK